MKTFNSNEADLVAELQARIQDVIDANEAINVHLTRLRDNAHIVVAGLSCEPPKEFLELIRALTKPS